MRKVFALLLIVCTLAACGDSTVAPDPALHYEVIYTVMTNSGTTAIVRGMSDGTGQRLIHSSGSLVAAPVKGRILYVEGTSQRLYSGSIDNSSATLIDRGSFLAGTLQSAAIAPDGERFLSVDWNLPTGTTMLSIQKMDGSERRVLSNAMLSQSKAAFSPDGLKIAFFGSDRRLYTITVDSTELTALTARPASNGRDAEASGWAPDWSPNGEWIAIESFETETIDVVRADGQASSVPSFLGAYPIWSRDGTQIAATSNQWVIVHPVNGTSRGIVAEPFDEWSRYPSFPRWSRDNGRLLPHMGASNTSSDLYSVDVASRSTTFIDSQVLNAYWVE